MSGKTEISVALRLFLDGRQFQQGLQQGTRGIDQFSSNTQRRFRDLGGAANHLRNQLAAVGLGFAGIQTLRQSAALDKSLVRIGQTAGGTRAQVEGLRAELFAMSRETGEGVEDLQSGFNDLVQAGLEWKQALAAIKAINPASAVTGANAGVLASGLTVGANAFGFDLAQVGVATKMLDQMTVAGRLGSAELEDLSSIFARVGVNARRANLDFSQTLAFVEALSKTEKQPERLATLADSTLRLFTNDSYRKKAADATHVKFYKPNGATRDPFDVLGDIAQKYRAEKTDKSRDRFIARAFQGADLDTQRGLGVLFAKPADGKEDPIQLLRSYTKSINDANGTVQSGLSDALNNAVDQSNRLKISMREVADQFSRPINKTLADLINWEMRSKDKGGLGLGPSGMTAATIAEVAGASALGYGAKAVLGRLPGMLGKIGGGAAGTATGLAQAKTLEKLAGVTPVAVVNWPDGFGSSGSLGGLGAGTASTAARVGGGALLPAAAGAALAAAAAGSATYGMAKILEAISANDNVDPRGHPGQRFVRHGRGAGNGEWVNDLSLDQSHVGQRWHSYGRAGGAWEDEPKATVEITVGHDGKPKVTTVKSSSKQLNVDVSTGPTMVHP